MNEQDCSSLCQDHLLLNPNLLQVNQRQENLTAVPKYSCRVYIVCALIETSKQVSSGFGFVVCVYRVTDAKEHVGSRCGAGSSICISVTLNQFSYKKKLDERRLLMKRLMQKDNQAMHHHFSYGCLPFLFGKIQCHHQLRQQR